MASQDASTIQALLDKLKSSDAWQRVANPSDVANAATGAHTLSGSVNDDAAANSEPGSTGNTHGDPNHDMPADNNATANLGTGSTSSAPSVASLLSQLQSSTALNALVGPGRSHPPHTAISPGSIPPAADPSQNTGLDATESSGNGHGTHPRAPHTPPEALRACTFQQSLPHLARLSEDPDFVRTLAAVSRDDDRGPESDSLITAARATPHRGLG